MDIEIERKQKTLRSHYCFMLMSTEKDITLEVYI